MTKNPTLKMGLPENDFRKSGKEKRKPRMKPFSKKERVLYGVYERKSYKDLHRNKKHESK